MSRWRTWLGRWHSWTRNVVDPSSALPAEPDNRDRRCSRWRWRSARRPTNSGHRDHHCDRSVHPGTRWVRRAGARRSSLHVSGRQRRRIRAARDRDARSGYGRDRRPRMLESTPALPAPDRSDAAAQAARARSAREGDRRSAARRHSAPAISVPLSTCRSKRSSCSRTLSWARSSLMSIITAASETRCDSRAYGSSATRCSSFPS